jgi:hypothetical protein
MDTYNTEKHAIPNHCVEHMLGQVCGCGNVCDEIAPSRICKCHRSIVCDVQAFRFSKKTTFTRGQGPRGFHENGNSPFQPARDAPP